MTMDLNRRQFSAVLGGSLALAGCASVPDAATGPAPKLYYLGQAKVFEMDAETGARDDAGGPVAGGWVAADGRQ